MPWRSVLATTFIAAMIFGTTRASAQQFGFDEECRALPPPGWMVQPQPPSLACLAQRAEAARQQESQRQQQAEQFRQQAIQRRAAFERQRAAELSPDNHCREQDVARGLMEEWSHFKVAKENDLTAVDIEHLTTDAFNSTSLEMTCHGVFVLSSGIRLIGIMRTRRNVAGDLITEWRLDPSQDLSEFDEPPLPPAPPFAGGARVSPKAPAAAGAEDTSAAAQGLADRRQLEAWRNTLGGDERAGADWWAAHRSLRSPGLCSDVPVGLTAAWTKGCAEAQQILAPSDARRHADPSYRTGWNSY